MKIYAKMVKFHKLLVGANFGFRSNEPFGCTKLAAKKAYAPDHGSFDMKPMDMVFIVDE